MGRLTQAQLLKTVLSAVEESGWQVIVLKKSKPFEIRVFRESDQKVIGLSIYIWNCTHGGGSARAANEFRVQITGAVPGQTPGLTTLVLGWHSGYDVFAGFDIQRHLGQASKSPSIQIKEETLKHARDSAFAVHHRGNEEIAVAFRPEYFLDYALNSASFHLTGQPGDDIQLLNNLGALDEARIEGVISEKRRIIISTVARRYRAADFRKRVLDAYSKKCAVCDTQLRLIDAAHIIPVAAPESTDETRNGVALCKSHHLAFDQRLLSFDEKYKIEVSETESGRLTAEELAGGLPNFKKQLRPKIILPSKREDYPCPTYIAKARKIRRWELWP